MKSGPTLNPWTASPRRRNASSNPGVTVVLPTPLATPATTMIRGDLTDGHYQARSPVAKAGLIVDIDERAPRMIALPAAVSSTSPATPRPMWRPTAYPSDRGAAPIRGDDRARDVAGAG